MNLLPSTINKFGLYLVKSDFKLIFDKEFSPQKNHEVQNNVTVFHLKMFLLFWTEYFSERGYKFSHVREKCFTTVSSIRYMTYELYKKVHCKFVI